MKKYLLVTLALTICLAAIAYWRSKGHFGARQLETMEARWKRESYQVVSQSQDALIHALFTDKIQSGTSIDAATSLTRPAAVATYGRYSIYDFDSPGYSWRRLIVDGNQIVSASAGNCTWAWTFFDDIPQKDWTAISHVRELRKYQMRFPDTKQSIGPKINDLLSSLQ